MTKNSRTKGQKESPEMTYKYILDIIKLVHKGNLLQT